MDNTGGQNVVSSLKQVQTLGIALILVKNTSNNKFLAVNENDGTWWLPGGKVDAPQLFSQGAIRQALQQAGINICLKGILRFQLSPNTQFIRNKIIFYAQPKDPNQQPKKFKDKQSICAKYLTLEQILSLKSLWRGPQLYQWSKYISNGGKIHSLKLLSEQLIE